MILSYLDHQSLCKLAATCKLIHSHCYDSLQYTDLNLQPYWTQVNQHQSHQLWGTFPRLILRVAELSLSNIRSCSKVSLHEMRSLYLSITSF